MSQFGDLLRAYRQRCREPENGKSLTQERLGELLAEALGEYDRYSGQAVSLWERGESKIRIDGRRVLIGLLEVLRDCGGVESVSDANELLLAGDYRPLNDEEKLHIFPDEPIQAAVAHGSGAIARPSLKEFFFQSISEELYTLLTEAAQGPPPAWPRILVVLLRWPLDRLTSLQVLRAMLWIGIWLLTGLMLNLSLRWPFVDQEQARTAAVLYAGGTLVTPLLTGVLTSTRANPFWRQHGWATLKITRLYTYQGAFIGFHLGYLAIFAVSLAGYYLGIGYVPWLGLAAMVLPVGLSYAAARLVPYNLWRAYNRLHINDGAVFFIFLVFGLGWAAFFYALYPWLLTPVTGLLIWFSAITTLAGLLAWQQRRIGTSIIPGHLWILIYGVILILYEASRATAVFSVVSLAGLIVTLVALLAQGRAYITLLGSIGLLVSSGVLLVCFWINALLGIGIAIVIVLIWRRWGAKFVRFPLGFWVAVFAVGIGSWLVRQSVGWDIPVSLVFSLIVLLICFGRVMLSRVRRGLW